MNLFVVVVIILILIFSGIAKRQHLVLIKLMYNLKLLMMKIIIIILILLLLLHIVAILLLFTFLQKIVKTISDYKHELYKQQVQQYKQKHKIKFGKEPEVVEYKPGQIKTGFKVVSKLRRK